MLHACSSSDVWFKHAGGVSFTDSMWGFHIARCYLWKICVQDDKSAEIDTMTGLTFALMFCSKIFELSADILRGDNFSSSFVSDLQNAIAALRYAIGCDESPESSMLWERGGWTYTSRRRDVIESFVHLERVCEDIRVGQYENCSDTKSAPCSRYANCCATGAVTV